MTEQTTDLIPGPNDEGLSTNDYCARLPRRRHSALAKGLLLEFPRTGLVGVPHTPRPGGGWALTVIQADRHGTYQPDGYDLYVSDIEIETAVERAVGERTNLDQRKPEPSGRFKGPAAKG